MNTNNPWLQQKLNEEHQRQLREFAEREHAAQLAQSEAADNRPRRSLLTKLRAEMTNLTTRKEQPEATPIHTLQRQS